MFDGVMTDDVGEQSVGRNAEYDVVVIGGGAAGLSGALALARSLRTVLVVDDGRPRNAPAAHIHNYLSRDGAAPSEVLVAGRAEVAGYGGRIVSGAVASVERLNGEDGSDGQATQGGRIGFRVTLTDGASVRARRLLVATGAVDELPDLPGVAERWGRDVLHCPYCHGYEVRDQAIGILATGPMAVHSALLFSQLSADVILFRHTAPALSEEQAAQLAVRGVAVVEGEVAALEIHGDRLTGVRMRSGAVIPRQAIVVAPRILARVGALSALGLEATNLEIGGYISGSYIPADPNGATSVPGVWVAGNVADPMAQVITSAAAGLKVGAIINFDLLTEDITHAMAPTRLSAITAQ